MIYPGTKSFKVVIFNIQASIQVAEADLGRQRPLEAAAITSMYQILSISMLYVVLSLEQRRPPEAAGGRQIDPRNAY